MDRSFRRRAIAQAPTIDTGRNRDGVSILWSAVDMVVWWQRCQSWFIRPERRLTDKTSERGKKKGGGGGSTYNTKPHSTPSSHYLHSLAPPQWYCTHSPSTPDTAPPQRHPSAPSGCHSGCTSWCWRARCPPRRAICAWAQCGSTQWPSGRSRRHPRARRTAGRSTRRQRSSSRLHAWRTRGPKSQGWVGLGQPSTFSSIKGELRIPICWTSGW